MKLKIVMGIMLTMFLGMLTLASNTQQVEALSSCSTIVGGHISQNTTWTLEGSPYILVEDCVVEQNVFLVIDPGVIVKFASGTSLIVDGSLIAKGNETHPITFTSNSSVPLPGDWKGIKFRKGSLDRKCILEWATVKYAESAISYEGSRVTVKNSTIKCNVYGIKTDEVMLTPLERGSISTWNCVIAVNGEGIYIRYSSAEIHTTIFSHNRVGIRAEALSHVSISESIISYNEFSCIIVSGSYFSATNSTISYNGGTGIFFDVYESEEEVRFCNIYNNKHYGISNYQDYGNDVDARYNWWGTTNMTLIDQMIYDYYDNYNHGKVLYQPFLNSSAVVPPYPYDKDLTPPTIDVDGLVQTPKDNVLPGQDVRISVNVTDNLPRINAFLLYNVSYSEILHDPNMWIPIHMDYNSTSGLYEAIIPGQLEGTRVSYKIIAYDESENVAVQDDDRPYFVYQVIPEFPSALILPLFMILSLITVAFVKFKKKKQ